MKDPREYEQEYEAEVKRLQTGIRFLNDEILATQDYLELLNTQRRQLKKELDGVKFQYELEHKVVKR